MEIVLRDPRPDRRHLYKNRGLSAPNRYTCVPSHVDSNLSCCEITFIIVYLSPFKFKLPSPIQLVVWSSHNQQPWKNVYEDSTHPRCHYVRLGRPKVYIEHHHSYTYTKKIYYDNSNNYKFSYLNVSRIIVNNTNLPSSGTTNDVGGIISASSRKNTVSDSRMDIDKLT